VRHCCHKHKFHEGRGSILGEGKTLSPGLSLKCAPRCTYRCKDGTIGQNTFHFLLVFSVFCSNFGRISYHFSQFYVEITLLGDCDL